MSKFAEKIAAFAETTFPERKDHYQNLAAGQKPHTFLITCSDSRLSPEEISESQAGENFIIRNAGNLIPPYSPNEPTNEGLTLEYGVKVLGIPEIVVCGHASCGAMGGLADLNAVRSLHLVHKALSDYKEAHESEIKGKDLDELIAWNVDKQLENLYSYPFIKEALRAGKLKVYGMVYDFVNAKVPHKSELKSTGEVQ